MAYFKDLSRVWALAQAERVKGCPTVISTFAGGGGSSLGYKISGCDVRLAVEWAAYPAECYRANFPETEVVEGDIAELSVDQALELARLESEELTILDGSPPCQGFSTNGKRRIADPRNSLFSEFVRLLCGLRPRAFIMENVTGLVQGKMKWVFGVILKELRDSGYRCSARVLGAHYFGVPQARHRLFVIGVRNDLDIDPSHPTAQTTPITVAQAFEGVDVRYILSPPLKGWHDSLARRLAQDGRGNEVFGASNYASFHKLNQNLPSSTLSATGAYGGAPNMIHPEELRGLSIGEAKRLGSFPDEYVIPPSTSDKKTWERAWAVIGNSVPPLLARAVAKHVTELVK